MKNAWDNLCCAGRIVVFLPAILLVLTIIYLALLASGEKSLRDE